MRILLVEDDPLLGDGTQVGLRQDGHAVDWVQTAELARSALRDAPFDLVLLDIGLPGMDGRALLDQLRREGLATPVIFLTARDAPRDRVLGLDLGADDYITKPFDLDELCARVRAISRRALGRATPRIAVGDIDLDPAAHTVRHGGALLEMTPREFALLRILLERSGEVVPRQRLQDALYGWSEEVGSNALEVHIHHLRRKLGEAHIRTVRGIGYAFVAEP